MSRVKKSKRRKVITLILVLVILAGCGVVAYLQANNIKALWLFGSSPERKQELLTQNEDAIRKLMGRLSLEELHPLTPEQEELLRTGKLTEEEALQLIMGELLGEKGANDPTEGEQEVVPAGNSADLQKLLARIYLLRSTFTGRLNGLVGQAKQEYLAIQGKGGGAAIAKKYISKGLALERECDGQMEALLGEIKSELEKTGGDISVIAEIRSTYENEKSIQKAALLDQYL